MSLTMEQEQELTLNEVARQLRVTRHTARLRILQGLLKARKEGRDYRVKVSDLEDYLRRTEVRLDESSGGITP